MRKAIENTNESTNLLNVDDLSQKLHVGQAQAESESEEEKASFERRTSSFISRRRFVSKHEKAALEKGAKSKEQSLDVLQQGINRPSVAYAGMELRK